MVSTLTRREITVASVGNPPPRYPGPGHSEDALVATMMDFWRQQIEPVLLDAPDLVVLPELFDRYDECPLDVVVGLRPAMLAASREMLAEVAREHRCYVAPGWAVPDADGDWHNSASLLDRSGAEIARYDKLRLVPTEFEYGLLPGREPVVVDTDFGRVGFALCFDLNFVELIELHRPLQPDVMLFPSRYHGGLMQAFWANQLRSHFIGSVGIVNLTSDVLSPVGHRIAGSTNYQQWVTTKINTNCAVVHLDNNRAGPLQALKQARGAAVTITDPGELGQVLITSHDSEVPVADLMAEFGIEGIADYLARSRQVNQQAGAPARPVSLQ
ncbi:carbon-nitrogen hydrolase family protein [Propionibacteriaceae bacterium Y2011]